MENKTLDPVEDHQNELAVEALKEIIFNAVVAANKRLTKPVSKIELGYFTATCVGNNEEVYALDEVFVTVGFDEEGVDEEIDFIPLDDGIIHTNLDDPNRHNIGGSMNRPVRNLDPQSPRNLEHAAEPVHEEEFALDVDQVLHQIAKLLVSKNKKYGNSALAPSRIFSNADPVEQIKVRIDDKLSRMRTGTKDSEDTVMDLIGYLVLLKIAEKG